MLTPQQIAQAKAGSQPATSPTGGFTPEQAHQWINEAPQIPEDTSPLGQISQMAKQGVQHGAEGINEILHPEGTSIVGRALQGAEGAAKVIGGTAQTFFSPLAPALNPVNKVISSGIEKATTPVTENPAVQKFAMSSNFPYERVAGAASDIGTTALLAAPIKLGKLLPEGTLKTGIGKVQETYKNLEQAAKARQDEITRNTADEYIQHNYTKAIKPTIVGKTNPGQLEKYNANVKNAVKQIVANKDKLQLVDHADQPAGPLPQTIDQFRQSIEQTKANIFHQYDAMAKAAGDQGAIVAMKPIVTELQKVAQNKIVQDLHPDLANYAMERAKTLLSRWAYSTEEAQAAVQNLNRSLDAYMRNPSYETYSKASIDSLIANKLREGLDTVIENRGQAGYQSLRNAYASLKAIEKDVIKRGIVEARQTGGRGMNVGDIVSAEELIRGLSTHNPAALVTAGGIKAIQAFRRWQTDPNRAVKNMFEKADQVQSLGNPKPAPPSQGSSYVPSIAPEEGSVKGNPEAGFYKDPFSQATLMMLRALQKKHLTEPIEETPKEFPNIVKRHTNESGFIFNPFAKEMPTASRVIKDELDNSKSPSELQFNVVEKLKSMGEQQAAKAINSLDSTLFTQKEEFAHAAEKIALNNVTKVFDIPQSKVQEYNKPTMHPEFGAYTGTALQQAGLHTPPNYFSGEPIKGLTEAEKTQNALKEVKEGTFYHGANTPNALRIKASGFTPSKSMPGYGMVSLTSDSKVAQDYTLGMGEILPVKVHPKNIKVYPSMSEYVKAMEKMPGKTAGELETALNKPYDVVVINGDTSIGERPGKLILAKPDVLSVDMRAADEMNNIVKVARESGSKEAFSKTPEGATFKGPALDDFWEQAMKGWKGKVPEKLTNEKGSEIAQKLFPNFNVLDATKDTFIARKDRIGTIKGLLDKDGNLIKANVEAFERNNEPPKDFSGPNIERDINAYLRLPYKSATKPEGESIEQITERLGGWQPGTKQPFDHAVMEGDAETVRKMLPIVPKEYRERFDTRIRALIGDYADSPLSPAKVLGGSALLASIPQLIPTKTHAQDKTALEESNAQLDKKLKNISDKEAAKYLSNIIEDPSHEKEFEGLFSSMSSEKRDEFIRAMYSNYITLKKGVDKTARQQGYNYAAAASAFDYAPETSITEYPGLRPGGEVQRTIDMTNERIANQPPYHPYTFETFLQEMLLKGFREFGDKAKELESRIKDLFTPKKQVSPTAEDFYKYLRGV